ncbi:ABC transporter permease [Roseomonas sp. CECT 9278]|uniref:ABC transporter permease n=1 Tax=Roseomonas sp. CECT 9278 TaxID=2845823 RepID=UPI001E5E7AD7|nr:ABC transporter permease [Roseomonas sp. CECT 9278]CAH0161518.1 Inner membrane ABC transporter permease protein YdcV [Roseomonas sp. CECT 9278]
MIRNGPVALLFHAVFIGFMLAPLVLVCVVSFTDRAFLSLPSWPPSLRWYHALAENADFIRAFRTSLWLGLASATLAVVLSVPAAMAIARHPARGAEPVRAFLLSPLLVPHVVLGVAFLRFFSGAGINGTFVALLVAHVLIILPYALQLVLAAAYGVDPRLGQAAVSLGAQPLQVFRRVTLPLLMPGIASGWLLAFLHSFDELTMTVFLADPGTTTLPVRLYLHIEETIDPLVTAASSLLIIGALVLMALLDRLYGLDRLLAGKGR